MAGELFTQDLRRNSVTWILADPAAFADRTKPKVAELNSINERLILDITCALDEDGTSFTLGSSEQDTRLSFCDGVGASRPGEINPELVLAIFRDKDRNATGAFNKALNWLRHADQMYYLIQRVGDQDTGPTNSTPAAPFTATDLVRMMGFRTDFPVDTLADGDPAMITSSALTAGFINWNFEPTA